MIVVGKTVMTDQDVEHIPSRVRDRQGRLWERRGRSFWDESHGSSPGRWKAVLERIDPPPEHGARIVRIVSRGSESFRTTEIPTC